MIILAFLLGILAILSAFFVAESPIGLALFIALPVLILLKIKQDEKRGKELI